ncbi:hypothetical protein SAMN05444955_11520 [Lihuaxuella thermophila]|uniref:Protein kinase domain-containing protein n=2 Tax=Lihuaxuella thermophila TaxID=1173111 RepID=A0A1H8HSF6_9BACL|nr:hypothetical protein SAMN05444955_11520 [Lihuaxuella thermophila]
MKAQGEWIRDKYRILKAFPFVIGVLYFTEANTKLGPQTRFVHALDVKAAGENISEEPILARDDSVFFPVREMFIEDGVLYQVFYRLEGNLLAHYIRHHAPLPVSDMAWMVRGITSHLLRLYREGSFTIVHPQNIIITSGNAIRFLYGGPIGVLPKGIGADRLPREDALEMNHLYDSYTVGTLIYQMLTGKNPLAAGIEVPPISTYRPDCPGELEELVKKALSFAVRKRPRIEEIFGLLDHLTVSYGYKSEEKS